jgi:hypothetical protein
LDEDLSFGVVDGANDLGCDFIYRDDGQVLVIQAKHRSSSATEDGKDISHFKSILRRFRDKQLTANKKLADAIAEIDWDLDQFELVFICFSRLIGQARVIADQSAGYPPDVGDLDERCEWKFLDESDLNVALRNARSFLQGVSNKPYKLYPIGTKGHKGSSVISVDTGGHKSYVMTLPATQLVGAYKALGQDAIFSSQYQKLYRKY